jgi:hypothetical protein
MAKVFGLAGCRVPQWMLGEAGCSCRQPLRMRDRHGSDGKIHCAASGNDNRMSAYRPTVSEEWRLPELGTPLRIQVAASQVNGTSV